MTLSSSTNIVQYSGTGAQTSFSVTFIFWDLDDLRVIHRAADGTETVWVRGTQYTLTGGDGATGTLTVVTSPTDYTPASGTTLTIKSNIGSTQPTDLPAGGAFPSSSVEEQMDKIVRMIQQRSAELDRSLKFAETDSTSLSATIPNSADRASKYLAFDADGEPMASAVAAGGAAASTFMETVLDDTTAAAARTTLGAAATGAVNTFTATQSWAKGADIASAATLVLGTDGNYFDVTGSTGPITAITVAAGTLFMLQFDSTPTLTHHATALNLPGAANIIAAAGDRLIGFATAANTVHVLDYIRANEGEYVSSSVAAGSAVSLTSGASANVTSISLTAGDWDIFGGVGFTGNAATTMTVAIGGISTVSATVPGTSDRETRISPRADTFAQSSFITLALPTSRISLSSTTTVYLVANSTFAVNTNSAYGAIAARRVL